MRKMKRLSPLTGAGLTIAVALAGGAAAPLWAQEATSAPPAGGDWSTGVTVPAPEAAEPAPVAPPVPQSMQAPADSYSTGVSAAQQAAPSAPAAPAEPAPPPPITIPGPPFATVITVNGLGISNYEIEQRMRFMRVLGQSGDLRKQAEQSLIEDRLRMWQAKRDGITISNDDVKQGMDEFASRGNLSSDQLVAALSHSGVDEQTFRDFVRAGMIWRYVVRAHFGQQVKISDAQVDRAMAVEAERGRGTRVLLSEIIIPAPPGQEATAQAIARKIAALHGEAAFSDAARQVSASGSRDAGGRLAWLPLDNLPPPLRPMILALKPGQPSAPVDLNGAIGIFMLRGMDGNGAASTLPQTIGYATVALGAAGEKEAARLAKKIATDVRTCDDLYTVTRDNPALLTRVAAVSQTQIPQDIAVELSHMDAGQTALLGQGEGQRLLMLCSRTAAQDAADGTDGTAGQAAQKPATQPDGAETAAAKGQDSSPKPAEAPKPASPLSFENPAVDAAMAANTPKGTMPEYDTGSGRNSAARNAVRDRLMSQQLAVRADRFLADLKADAVIVRNK